MKYPVNKKILHKNKNKCDMTIQNIGLSQTCKNVDEKRVSGYEKEKEKEKRRKKKIVPESNL